MYRLTSKILKNLTYVKKPFVGVTAGILLVLSGTYIFSQPRLAGDTASHMLLAVSPILDFGSPYKDLWEIKPPTWPFIVYVWSRLFGFGIFSIKLLNLLLIIFITITVYFIYKKIFKTPILEILFAYTLLINLSPLLNTFILPTEIVGLAFSLFALLILFITKDDSLKYYFSGLFFFLASQSKEPYTFTILSVFPFLLLTLLKQNYFLLLKNITRLIGGILTGAVILLAYLGHLGSLDAYGQIFQFKGVYFPFSFDRLSRNFGPALTATNNTFIEFYGGIYILLFLAFLIFLLTNKFTKTLYFKRKQQALFSKTVLVFDSNNLTKYSAILYAVGSFAGLGLGGVFGSHYLIQVPIPFYMLMGIIISYIYGRFLFVLSKDKKTIVIGLLILTCSLIVALPKRQYLKSYLPQMSEVVLNDKIYSYEDRIAQLTSKDQCVLSVYGWGVSENYLYSKRRPCTRFFLPNMVKLDWQKKEYAKSVIENPPAVIVYHPGGSDMDVAVFEKEVVNINKIVKNCYIMDTIEEVIFIPFTVDSNLLKQCVKINSK